MLLGYTRVSTVEQAGEDKTSLDIQSDKIYGYAQLEQISKHDVMIFTDAGVSGGIPLRKRPGGADLLAMAKSGDTIIASKLDRMFRSTGDAINTIESLRENKIDLILLDLFHTPVTSDGIARLLFTMLAAMGEFERSIIKERTNSGRQAKRAKGGAIGKAPFGFRKVGEKTNAVLVPDEREREIIGKVQKLYPRLGSAGAVARELDTLGYRTRAGKPIHKRMVSIILERGDAIAAQA